MPCGGNTHRAPTTTLHVRGEYPSDHIELEVMRTFWPLVTVFPTELSAHLPH